jgi:tetratricopeptide (TPR) repeat protein
MRDVDGVDPDNTTDAKLIEAYGFLSSTERNTLGIQHRGAYRMYSAKRYKDAFEAFTKLTDDYPGNYLSAYWAGTSASKLKSYKEAIKWFDIALAINPNYQPAVDGKAQAEASDSKGSKKK